jgi:acetyl esterase/lipase
MDGKAFVEIVFTSIFTQGYLMKSLSSFVVLSGIGLLAAPPAPAADTKAIFKTGGNFKVVATKDIPYVEGKEADPDKHKLDLYVPKGKKEFPVLFFVHGGAWKNGDRKLYPKLGDVFAKNGVGTVIISYRLTPKVQHPAHIQDVARAFAWTHRNIAKYGGRADQIFVCGHSAGGHLVALLGTNESYLKAEKLALADIKGVIPMSGVFQITPIERLAPVFGTDEKVCAEASPINYVNGKHPPFLFIYADKDYPNFDKYAETMCQALQQSHCAAETLLVKDRTHITLMVQVAKEEDPATQAILGFIAKHSDLKLVDKEAKPEKNP